jgi:hypothetical protein
MLYVDQDDTGAVCNPFIGNLAIYFIGENTNFVQGKHYFSLTKGGESKKKKRPQDSLFGCLSVRGSENPMALYIAVVRITFR